MNLEEFRKQNPAYNDLSDQELATSLHEKFYSDVPFDQFSKTIQLKPQKASIPNQIWSGFKEGVKDNKLGLDMWASQIYNTLANIPMLLDRMAEGIATVSGVEKGGAFKIAEDTIRDMAKKVAPTPETLKDRNSFISKINQALGGAPGTIMEYAIPIKLLKGAPLGMAVVDALKASDKGWLETGLAALRGAMLGGVLHSTEEMGRLSRAATVGGVFGTESALRMDDVRDVMVSGITGFGLGAMGGPGGKRGFEGIIKEDLTKITPEPVVEAKPKMIIPSMEEKADALTRDVVLKPTYEVPPLGWEEARLTKEARRVREAEAVTEPTEAQLRAPWGGRFEPKNKLLEHFREDVEPSKIDEIVEITSQMPKGVKESVLNAFSKLGGKGAWTESKVADLVRVPLWHPEVEPLVKELDFLDRRSSAMTYRARKKLGFLQKYPISSELSKAIFDSTLEERPINIDRLTPSDKLAYLKVRDVMDDMIENLKTEMKNSITPSGRPTYKTIAEKEGFSDINAYIDDFVKQHRKEEYFPLIRGKGKYFTLATKDKETLWSQNFESPREAKQFAQILENEFPDADVSAFNIEDTYKLKFSEFLNFIHDVPYMTKVLEGRGVPAERIEELSSILSGRYLDLWAKGRLSHREGAPGFSMQVKEVLDHYIESFPRSLVRRFSAGRVAGVIERMPSELQNYGKNLQDYYLGRVDQEGKVNFALRSLLYNWNLAAKPSFGLLNLTQRGMTTLPRLMKEVGMFKGSKIFLDSQAAELEIYRSLIMGRHHTLWEAIKDSRLSDIEKSTLRRALEEGVFQNIRSREVAGRGRINDLLNIFGNLSERSNRIHSAIAGVRAGQSKGLTGERLYNYTLDMIYKTQWLYSKANRPEIGRGWKAPAFVFKNYVLNDIKFLESLYPDKPAFVSAMAFRLALGGLKGFYGANTFAAIVDWGMEQVAGAPDWKLRKKEAVDSLRALSIEKTGVDIPRILLRGLPTLVGLEGSITFGSPELFDIALFPVVNTTKALVRNLIERGGVDPYEAWRRIMPTAVKHVLGFSTKDIFGKEKITIEDAIRAVPELKLRILNQISKLPPEMSDWEKVLYGVGFTTTTPSEFYDTLEAIRDSTSAVRRYKTELHRSIAQEIVQAKKEGRKADIDKLIKEAVSKGIMPSEGAIERQVKAKKYPTRLTP